MLKYIALVLIGLSISFSWQANADYLDLSASAVNGTTIGISWNGYVGGTFKVRVKQGGSVVFSDNNITQSDVSVGSGFSWYLQVNGLNCNTEYKVKVKLRGRGWRRVNVRTNACKPPAKSCPFGGWFDGANCYLGSAPNGTTAFIYAGNYYYTALPGPSCPLPGTWYDGANCFVQAVPPGATPFIFDNNWYYVPFP